MILYQSAIGTAPNHTRERDVFRSTIISTIRTPGDFCRGVSSSLMRARTSIRFWEGHVCEVTISQEDRACVVRYSWGAFNDRMASDCAAPFFSFNRVRCMLPDEEMKAVLEAGFQGPLHGKSSLMQMWSEAHELSDESRERVAWIVMATICTLLIAPGDAGFAHGNLDAKVIFVDDRLRVFLSAPRRQRQRGYELFSGPFSPELWDDYPTTQSDAYCLGRIGMSMLIWEDFFDSSEQTRTWRMFNASGRRVRVDGTPVRSEVLAKIVPVLGAMMSLEPARRPDACELLDALLANVPDSVSGDDKGFRAFHLRMMNRLLAEGGARASVERGPVCGAGPVAVAAARAASMADSVCDRVVLIFDSSSGDGYGDAADAERFAQAMTFRRRGNNIVRRFTNGRKLWAPEGEWGNHLNTKLFDSVSDVETVTNRYDMRLGPPDGLPDSGNILGGVTDRIGALVSLFANDGTGEGWLKWAGPGVI
jgi:hypothetical protein